MISFSAQVKMAKTRRSGRKGKKGRRVITRRRVQRGGQDNLQAIVGQIEELLKQLPTAAKVPESVPGVSQAAEAVDKAIAEVTDSTPAAPVEASENPAGQTGGKTTKKGKKRKLKGFMKYANTSLAALMKSNPGAKIGDIGKMLGAGWRKMSDAAKKAFA